MAKTFLIIVLLTSFAAAASEPAEVELTDLWNADPVTDAIRVAESDAPYLLQPHVLGPPRIPPYKTKEEASCWIESIEVRLLNGFSDVGGFESQRQNAVLSLYAHYFNGQVMRRLKSLQKSDCDL